ncbi:MAG TPA: SDR family oxidoreductase [Thermoplasmata archaeon]|nr:SDR family oxidoreductase [Thermoplasmata archaeon]
MATSPGTRGTGQVAVVTGATSGIGREIARRLAADGYTVVVVGRGEPRAAATAAAIARETGNPRVESVGVTDLARPGDVRRLAATLLAKYPRIHVLVNNAGAFFRRREVTAEGLERTFALNVLAPFLLTSLLEDRLKESAPARVVNMASDAHLRQKLDLSDLQSGRAYAGFRAYGVSKLELILLTREFARRLAGTGVSVNAVHPGFVASGFGKNNGGGTKIAITVLGWLFAKSVRRGAVTPVLVAEDPSLASVSGEYFANERVVPGDPASRDPEAGGRLFAAVDQIAGPLSAPS